MRRTRKKSMQTSGCSQNETVVCKAQSYLRFLFLVAERLIQLYFFVTAFVSSAFSYEKTSPQTNYCPGSRFLHNSGTLRQNECVTLIEHFGSRKYVPR